MGDVTNYSNVKFKIRWGGIRIWGGRERVAVLEIRIPGVGLNPFGDRVRVWGGGDYNALGEVLGYLEEGLGLGSLWDWLKFFWAALLSFRERVRILRGRRRSLGRAVELGCWQGGLGLLEVPAMR